MNDPYFAEQRRDRIMREQRIPPSNFGRRRVVKGLNSSQQNNRDLSSNNIVPNYHRYQEEVQTNTYNDEDENEDGNVDSSNTSVTTIIPSTSNEENSQSDNMVGLYDDLNTNETDVWIQHTKKKTYLMTMIPFPLLI